MRTYAYINEGVVDQILSTDLDITTLFNPQMEWVDVTDVEPMPAERWLAQKVSGSWTFSPPPTA
jgi:hypothetical protein